MPVGSTKPASQPGWGAAYQLVCHCSAAVAEEAIATARPMAEIVLNMVCSLSKCAAMFIHSIFGRKMEKCTMLYSNFE